MTRFAGGRKGSVNYQASQTGIGGHCIITGSDPAGDDSTGKACKCRVMRPIRRIIGFLAPGLLIVRGVFFIHRGNGEVAEWSKALPC